MAIGIDDNSGHGWFIFSIQWPSSVADNNLTHYAVTGHVSLYQQQLRKHTTLLEEE